MSSNSYEAPVQDSDADFEEGNEVNKQSFIDDDGNVDFDKLQEAWQANQSAVNNGLQQVQIFHKNGEAMYFKARLAVVVDLMEQWFEVRKAMASGGVIIEPIWFAVTGAFCNSVDLRDVHGIQARPGGNYRGGSNGNNRNQRRPYNNGGGNNYGNNYNR